MDLDLQEVAELLNVPEERLLGWIEEGTLPAYRHQDRYLLTRTEVEEWLLSHQPTHDGPSRASNRFALFRALHRGEVVADIAASSKEDLIAKSLEHIATTLNLDTPTMVAHFLEREQQMPTALGQGYGIPHTRDLILEGGHDSVSVVFLQEPISYGALDGQPVHTLFFLLARDDRQHLHLLAKIAHLVTTPEMRDMLATRPDKSAFLRAVQQWESTLTT